MTEATKWRSNSKRLSLSMKDIDYHIDYDDDDTVDHLSITQSIDWEEHFSKPKDTASETSEQDQEIILTKKQTLILATMVPNELLLMEK